ncbi:MAG: VWA domain-containing protein [Gammaproteobacteria bacterium]
MLPEQFHFLRPAWLLALLPLAVVVWLMVKRKLGSRGWESFCDPALLPYILAGQSSGRSRLPVLLTALCGFLAIIALAGPVWDKLPQPVFSNESSLVIALDLSRSMAADDISPSRLGRARFKIRDILDRRPDGRTALLVYAGDAFTVTPLTDDVKTIVSQLQALDTEIMPVQGYREDLALRHAGQLLQQAGAGRGDVLLITDEVEGDRGSEAARELNEDGYRVSVLGVGTEHGVPVPLGDGGFLKDARGEIVIPVLDEAPMRRIAEAGGGIYLRLQRDNSDLDRLVSWIDAAGPGGIQATEMETDVWRERGPWLLLLVLPLAALAFRRGYVFILVCLILPFPEHAHAFDWDSLWWRDDQRARQALEEGDNERAAALFRDPAWKGVARYRSGDYQAAVEALKELEGADNLYNLGNALARMGRYQGAVEAYEKALQMDPEHEDAAFNKQVVEEELKKQQQQSQQQSQQDQQQQDQDQDKPGDQDSSQDERGDPDEEEPPAQERPEEPEDSQPGRQESSDQDKSQQPPEQEPSGEEQTAREDGEEKQPRDQPDGSPVSPEDLHPDEQKQAVEQWLRRIPDDPGELLRRKFLYQYQQRRRERSDEQSW